MSELEQLKSELSMYMDIVASQATRLERAEFERDQFLESTKAFLILLEGFEVNTKLTSLRDQFFARGTLGTLTESLRRKIARAEGADV